MAMFTEYKILGHSDIYSSWATAKRAAQRIANDTGLTQGFVKRQNSNTWDKPGAWSHVLSTVSPAKGKQLHQRKTNPGKTIPIGKWTSAKAIRRNADGTIDILREKASREPNISQGHMAGGVFHPIRSASDYDPSRVGEGGKKKKRKVAKKRTGSTKKKAPARKRAAMVTSRREYGGDGSRYTNPKRKKAKRSR